MCVCATEAFLCATHCHSCCLFSSKPPRRLTGVSPTWSFFLPKRPPADQKTTWHPKTAGDGCLRHRGRRLPSDRDVQQPSVLSYGISCGCSAEEPAAGLASCSHVPALPAPDFRGCKVRVGGQRSAKQNPPMNQSPRHTPNHAGQQSAGNSQVNYDKQFPPE